MSDMTEEYEELEIPEIPDIVEHIVITCLEEGKEKLEQDGMVIPFTALAVKDNLFIETHPGDSAEECINLARHTVQGARGASAYAFCYEGYVETNLGMQDVLLASGGVPGEDIAYVVGYLYTTDEDGNVLEIQDEPVYIGEDDNYMAGLKAAEEYSDEEIPEDYLADEEEEGCGCGCGCE